MGASARWAGYHALRYPGMAVDTAAWKVSFEFLLEGPQPLWFRETLALPAPPTPPSPATLRTLHQVLELLYLAAGTSYYKIAAPPAVRLDSLRLAAPALPWARALFRQGMAEFAYRNDLPHVLELELTGEATAEAAASGQDHSGGSPLVPVGGGKDSVVTVEALRAGGYTPVQFSVDPNDLRTGVMAVAGLGWLTATRGLDRQLFTLNRAGAYNGHVPVTAINSLIAVATAVLHGLGPVVMSNERSASVGNLDWHGHQVNHQWSKGIDAEVGLREALAGHAGLHDAYFSLLRPLSELHIARLFAPFEAYDPVVTSCNAAFRINDPAGRWCGDCPKCRFVFLALAPFMPRSRLVGIFGAALLDDPAQLTGYRELAGLSAHKPFECVGEPAETRAALRLLDQHEDWGDAVVVRQLRQAAADPGWLSDDEFRAVFQAAGPHFAPEPYLRTLELIEVADATR